jgi:hypothetical protein
MGQLSPINQNFAIKIFAIASFWEPIKPKSVTKNKNKEQTG